jgi:hypothetical protein
MPRQSQYLEAYLAATAREPITPGTFLEERLRGRARAFHGRYRDALIRALHEECLRGRVRCVRSVGGSLAWVYADPWIPVIAKAQDLAKGSGTR